MFFYLFFHIFLILSKKIRLLSSKKIYSEDFAYSIDKLIVKMINEALAEAKTILETNKVLLDKLANTLLEKEVIEQDAFDLILKENPIKWVFPLSLNTCFIILGVINKIKKS